MMSDTRLEQYLDNRSESSDLASVISDTGYSALFDSSAHLSIIAAVNQSMMDLLPTLELFDPSSVPEQSASGSSPKSDPASSKYLPSVEAPPAPGQSDSGTSEPKIFMVEGSTSEIKKIELPKDKNPHFRNAVCVTEFASKAKALHVKLDENSDGFLSDTELAQAIQADIYKHQNARIVAALTSNRDELEELSDDEIGDENDGITIADLDKYHDEQGVFLGELASALWAKEWLEEGTNFTVLDFDKDGWISSSELRNARVTLRSEPIVTYLRENLDDIEEATDDETGDENDGITIQDIRNHVDLDWSDNQGNIVCDVFQTLWQTSESQKRENRTD